MATSFNSTEYVLRDIYYLHMIWQLRALPSSAIVARASKKWPPGAKQETQVQVNSVARMVSASCARRRRGAQRCSRGSACVRTYMVTCASSGLRFQPRSQFLKRKYAVGHRASILPQHTSWRSMLGRIAIVNLPASIRPLREICRSMAMSWYVRMFMHMYT